MIRPPQDASLEALDFNNIGLIAPGTMFARWALEKVGDLDEDFHMEMDLDLSLRLLEAGVPSALYAACPGAVGDLRRDQERRGAEA